MSNFDDIMNLLGPSVPSYSGPGLEEIRRPLPPAVQDTTSEANVWLPTSVAAHYKEYDRSGPAVDELEALIARDGLLTPIRISTDGREAVVHEGNHRLQVAERLGIPEVPAIITFDSPVFSNGGRVTPLEPVLGSWVEQNRGRLRSFWGHRTASDYFMQHRPAGPDYGGPMHDVSDFFPDIETLPTRMYDFGEPGSQDSIRQIIDAQGNPNKSVMIYRAVPKGADPIIRNGDWVTISREYAEQHGMSNVGGVYDILSATVQAKDIWTEGNSVNEFGYWGPELRTARTYTASVEDGSEYLRTPGAKIDWTPAEAPFDGIWFGFNGRDQTFASYYHAGIYDEDYYLLNKAWSDERIAKLQWTPSGEVAMIWTKSDYRRIGLATALFNWTKANIFPGLRHSDDMTSSGHEWAKSMGHDPEDWELMRALPHYAAEWQPWHSDDQEEAQEIAPGTTIYRGMKVDFSDSDFDQIWRWQQPPLVEEERGQHFNIGPFILDRLEPLGIHWTTKRRIAEIGASQGGYGGAGVIIEAEYTGTGQDLRGTAYHNDGWSVEEEITMLPGAQVRITGVFLTGIEKNKNLLRGPELRSAHRTAGTRTDPGGVYRGINVQVLSHDEQQELAEWANANAFSMYDYQLAEPNYELVYRILDRLDSGGLGRHWSKDYDVSADFARDQGDGIELILIGHWEGEGVDTREFHRGYDGIQRPSNLPHEEEVTLYPGTPVTLVGMDIVTETGFTYNIPVPNIQVTAGHNMKHLANRTAAAEKLYRGFHINLLDLSVPEDLYALINETLWDNPSAVAERMIQWVSEKGVGTWWSRSRQVAEWFASGGPGGSDTEDHAWLVLAADWSGGGEESSSHQWDNYQEEEQVIIGKGTSLTVTDAWVNGIHVPLTRQVTAAEPGGVLPWTPSHRGYTWVTHSDGTLEAVTNDGVNRMFLHEYPYGWEWEVFDSLGFVEGGTFGMALKGGDALRDRANDLLAEFDTRAERRTRGPSRGYQDDYTQAPNTLWSKRATTSQRYAERLRREGRR